MYHVTATTEIYTLSLHDALPISGGFFVPARAKGEGRVGGEWGKRSGIAKRRAPQRGVPPAPGRPCTPCICAPRKKSCERSEEHTSELQSRLHLVCSLLLEKKKDC